MGSNTLSTGIIFHNESTPVLAEGFKQGELLCHVYFRLKTPSYRSEDRVGFQSLKDENDFIDSANKFMASVGFTVDEGSLQAVPSNEGMIHRSGFLQIHPDHFSGYVSYTDIERIKSALEHYESPIFQFKDKIDVFSMRDLISIDELKSRLTIRQDQLNELLLQSLHSRHEEKFWDINSTFEHFRQVVEMMLLTDLRVNKDLGKQQDIILDDVNKRVAIMVENGDLKSFTENDATYYQVAVEAQTSTTHKSQHI